MQNFIYALLSFFVIPRKTLYCYKERRPEKEWVGLPVSFIKNCYFLQYNEKEEFHRCLLKEIEIEDFCKECGRFTK